MKKKQQAEDIVEGSAVSMSVSRLYRAIVPKRRWWGWALAVAAGWLLFGPLWLRGEYALYSVPWLVSACVTLFPPGAIALVALAFGFPAVLGVVLLASDRRTCALESLVVTGIDSQELLRVYHWRTLVTGALFLAAVVPCTAAFGRPPFPLMFIDDFFNPFWDHPGPVPGLTVHGLAPGFLTDLCTVYFAAALGLAALVRMRNRGWAMVLALSGLALFEAVAWLAGTLTSNALGRLGLLWPQDTDVLPKDGYYVFLWSFAVICSALALLAAEIVLRLAARRLDRLVTD